MAQSSARMHGLVRMAAVVSPASFRTAMSGRRLESMCLSCTAPCPRRPIGDPCVLAFEWQHADRHVLDLHVHLILS